MRLLADGQDAATLDKITIDLDAVGPGSVSVGKVSLEDGTFTAQRTAKGWLRVAGLELAPADNALKVRHLSLRQIASTGTYRRARRWRTVPVERW